MSMKDWWFREKYVALHAQSIRFRVIKYIVLLTIAVWIVRAQGWTTLVVVFFFLLILSLCMHFFFRWKTKAWTRSWGPYKALKIPHDGF